MKPTNPVLPLLLIALLALLAACDVGPTSTPTPVPPPSATPAPPTPPASPTPPAAPTIVPATPDPTKPVIVYEKSGGIAGVHDVLEIYADGRARWTPSRQASVTFRLPTDTVANLRAQFEAAHFFDFAAEYDNHNVADDFYYTITYTANGQTRQVTAAGVGGQDITPQALLDLITTLQQLAGQAANMTPIATAVPPTTAAVTPPAPGAQIIYDLSGGFAPIHEVLEITSQGAMRFVRNGQVVGDGTLTPDQLARLEAQFQAAQFFTLQDEYDRGTASDDRYMTITYTQGGQTKTVKVAEIGGQGLTPQPLLDLIAALSQISADLSGSAPPAPTTVVTAPPQATPSSAPTGVSGGSQEIIYGHSGGEGGLSDTLEIGADGVAHLSSRGQLVGTTTLTAAQLSSLAAQFEQAHFFDLQDRYDSGNVADDLYNSITYSRNGQTKSVTAAEVGGQGFTPQPLLDLIAALGQIADAIRAQPPPLPPSATPVPAPAVTVTTGSTEGSDLIIYRVKGGIAGVDTAMYIDRRGAVRFTSRGADTGTAQISADDLRALIDLFSASDFFNLQDRYAPLAAPADSQTISVTYNTSRSGKTVSVESGATSPESLNAVLVRLQAVQTQLQPK